jgi:maltokinase
VGGVRTLAWADDPDSDTRLQMALVDVESDGRTDVLQVPLSHRLQRHESLDHAYVGELDNRHVLRRAARPDAVGLLADALVRGDGAVSAEPSSRTRSAPRELDPDVAVSVLTGEQSNTNVRVAKDLLLKVFRRVAPWRNPDIEVLSALTRPARSRSCRWSAGSRPPPPTGPATRSTSPCCPTSCAPRPTAGTWR